MKHTITGEITTKTLGELAEIIEQEAHDVTCRSPTAKSIKAHADTIMHMAADMYASADLLSDNSAVSRE